MATSAVKFVVTFFIFISMLHGINCQILAIGSGFQQTHSLLKNVTDTSSTMTNILQHLESLLKDQGDLQSIANLLLENGTAKTDEMASLLPEVIALLKDQWRKQGKYQNVNVEAVTHLRQIQESQTVMANSFNELVTTVQDMSSSMDTMVSALQSIAHSLDQNFTQPITPVEPEQDITHDLPRNCLDLASRGNYSSGSYKIKPSDSSDIIAEVYCDMVTEGGGWTVFQRRFNGSVDFLRGWFDYERGFGDLNGEHWGGLKLLHLLTRSGSLPVLRVELESFDDENAYAKYESFGVGDSSSNYVLFATSFSGNGGDSLATSTGMPFTTYDKDNDDSGRNCAQYSLGAWWYWRCSCSYSNLNGKYLGRSGNLASYTGMTWYEWKNFNSLKASKMMLRHSP